MATKLELIVEAERRGILPEGKRAALAEARRRGLVGTTAEQPQNRSEILRQLGLTARAGIEGLAQTAGIVVDPINATIAQARGTQFEPLGQTAGRLLTRAGLPEPETATERVVGDVSRGLVGGGAVVRGAQAAPRALNVLAQAPGLQAAGIVGGAGAGGVARESGASPGTQVAATIAGSLAPIGAVPAVAATGRGLVRGGEVGRQNVERNVRSFERAGTTPTLGQATEGRIARSAETLASRVPGSSGVIARRAESQADEIGSGLDRIAVRLSQRRTAAGAGQSVERGVSGEGGFVESFKVRSRVLYNELDRHIPANTQIPLQRTQSVLDELSRPISGAERTSAALANPKLAGIRQALGEDLAASGALPYEAVRSIRTRVGDMVADSALVADVPKAQVKRLYRALTEDLEAAAKSAGAQASRALERANTFYHAGLKRLEVLERVVDKNGGPEAVFRAATSGTKDGAFVLRSVMQSLPKDNQRDLAAAVIRRLGRAVSSKQDEAGEVFSTETFLTNWNNLSKEAKGVLFNRFGPQFRRDMDEVARVAANLRAGSAAFANPSGTSQGAAQITTVGGLAIATFLGDLTGLAAGVSALGAANLSARLMTSPDFVRWLARSTRAPLGALPSQVNALKSIADRTGIPDIEDAARLLDNAVSEPN